MDAYENRRWIPAYAGMTYGQNGRLCLFVLMFPINAPTWRSRSNVIPA